MRHSIPSHYPILPLVAFTTLDTVSVWRTGHQLDNGCPRKEDAMELELTPEQASFRKSLELWLDEYLPEGWLDGDRDIPPDLRGREAFLRDWQRRLYEGSWAGIAWPEEHGGRDATLFEQVIYDQELARVDAPPEINATGLDFLGPTLIEWGTEAQRDRFLEPILTGEEVWCQGYSEPNAGSDLANLGTRAEADGDRYRITGQKIWTSGAHFSDWCFLLVRTDTEGDRHHGITALMVDMDQSGVTVDPIRSMDDEAHFNQVFFDDAVAARDHVIGDPDEGWRVAMSLSGYERTTSVVFDLERRWNELVQYCRGRRRGGDLLLESPTVRQRLADFDTRIQAAKVAYLRHVSERVDTDGSPVPEGMMDNVYGRELKQEFERFAHSLKGTATARWEPGSYADKHPLFRLRYDRVIDGRWTDEYLASFSLSIGGGTTDIKRNLIAERVLDLPKGLRAE